VRDIAVVENKLPAHVAEMMAVHAAQVLLMASAGLV
jgi:hypothetical protein